MALNRNPPKKAIDRYSTKEVSFAKKILARQRLAKGALRKYNKGKSKNGKKSGKKKK